MASLSTRSSTLSSLMRPAISSGERSSLSSATMRRLSARFCSIFMPWYLLFERSTPALVPGQPCVVPAVHPLPFAYLTAHGAFVYFQNLGGLLLTRPASEQGFKTVPCKLVQVRVVLLFPHTTQ